MGCCAACPIKIVVIEDDGAVERNAGRQCC
jgi:hypothetical protein